MQNVNDLAGGALLVALGRRRRPRVCVGAHVESEYDVAGCASVVDAWGSWLWSWVVAVAVAVARFTCHAEWV